MSKFKFKFFYSHLFIFTAYLTTVVYIPCFRRHLWWLEPRKWSALTSELIITMTDSMKIVATLEG